MTNFIKGTRPQSYLGVNASNPPNMLVLPRAPTTADTKNVTIGDFWLNETTEILYQLVNLERDVATWIEIATAAGGGAVFFDTDAGTATTTATQHITIHGGSNLNTSGAGNTVTYNLNNTVAISGSFTAGTGITSTTGNIVAASGSVQVTNTANSTASPTFITLKNRAGGAVQPNDGLGTISFNGFNGTTNQTSAILQVSVPASGTVAAGRLPSQFGFFTSPDSVNPPALRLAVSSTGEVTILKSDGNSISETVRGIRALVGITGGGWTNTSWIEGQFDLQTMDGNPHAILLLPVSAQEMILVKAQISGFRSDFSNCIVSDIFFGIYRPTAGDVTVIQAPSITQMQTSTENTNALANVGAQSAEIDVTGVAGQTYNWVCKYSYMYLISNA
jgi:hypothetical protein